MKRSVSPLRIGCHGTHATPANNMKRPLWAVANAMREHAVRAARFKGNVELVHGPADVPCAADEMIVVSIVRDAAMWIGASVDHYLSLGAKHVFFIDNGSSDDTIERAARHPRVTVYRTDLPFRHFEVGLRRWATKTLGARRWMLAPDADELWDYPGSDRLPLRDFLGYLNHHGYKAVAAHALDMFSDVPFSRLRSTPDDDLRATYRFYDISQVTTTRENYWFKNGQVRDDRLFCVFGGVRQQFFDTQCLCQTRHALHFADSQSRPYHYDGHFTAGAPVADVTTVLLHYKFLGTLLDQAQTNLALKNHHKGSENYRGFVEVLSRDPDFCLFSDTSEELQRIDQLVDRGFLTVSEAYVQWLESHAPARGRQRTATSARRA